MRPALSVMLIIFAIGNGLFFMGYVGKLKKGYASARTLCPPVEYRIEYVFKPLTFPTCFIMEKVR